MKQSHALSLHGIRINDAFWNKYTGLVARNILPYQWNALNDKVPGAEPSHSLRNYRIAAGLEEGEFHGAVFQDTDVTKWLEAVAYSLISTPDAELEARADEVIELIGAAQQPDGYLNTYYTIPGTGADFANPTAGHELLATGQQAEGADSGAGKEVKARWANLTEGHELYTAGHMIEAAVAYTEATGKPRFLEIARKNADLICSVFGEGENQRPGWPGHPEIELALMRLYNATGEKRYLETARYFIDTRGQDGGKFFTDELASNTLIFGDFSEFTPAYAQAHKPVREQDTAEGHAVRALYLYAAMVDVAVETGDDGLLDACKLLWDNTTARRMYLTGSVGTSGFLERFTTDYDLPNDGNYSESCASIALAMFGIRMARATGEAKYLDVMERALYNVLTSGIAMDGESFFYVNPMEVWPDCCMPGTSRAHVKPVRQKWFGVSCCPTNIARTLGSLGQYVYSQTDDGLTVNMYVGGTAKATLGGAEVDITLDSNFPREGSAGLRFEGVKAPFLLRLRIPAYAKEFTVKQNGVPVPYDVSGGFACLPVVAGGTYDISFVFSAVFVQANPKVRADSGKVAVVRGPQVYCLEECDNGENLAALFVDTKVPLVEEWDDALFGGCTVITAAGKRLAEEGWGEDELYREGTAENFADQPLRFVPYAHWGNRTPGEMAVWLKRT